ncbi:MAG TPA: NAD+ synthase [Tepidisphaeraceae bacterium]|jgi:NAD+ synthetase
MRIALAQINPTVGDLAGNTRKILDNINRAKQSGAQLIVFPELSIIGYPPKDLLLKPQFIQDNLRALNMIASRVQDITAVVGYAEPNPNPVGRPLYNAVAVLRDGQIASRHLKTLLPTYDVFDESRYFEPGPTTGASHVVRIGDLATGISICEDLWNDERLISRRLYHQNPIADLQLAGAQLIINSSASPFVEDKQKFRLELFSAQAKHFQRPILVVNQVGGNDELIFDGNSCAFDATGNLIAHAKEFEEDLVHFELDSASPRGTGFQPVHKWSQGIESIYKALILGLSDYVRKCGFKSVVLGLSGGIDSALTAAIAVAALGKDKVVGVAMPSRYSSTHSVDDARALAQNLGIEFHVVPIKDVHRAYEQTLATNFASPHSESPLGDDVTEQNIQARVRGALLMAFSNRYNHLLLTTGNKSELAVGYCTLYGDMCGGLALISDLPKTRVWELSRWINQNAGREIIPTSSITKVPSAELRPNQTDQDSLPPYEILDAIMDHYIEDELGVSEIIDKGFEPQIVQKAIRLIDRSEYKRRQAPPGLKVTSRAFGFGRRMPIAQRYETPLPKHGEPSPVIEEQKTA